jgi:Tol biopolymer transport system component
MVRYIAGGETVSLTTASGLQLPTRIDIGGPAISPDGSLIAFDAGAKPGTPSNLFDAWVIPAPLGGIARKLVERGRSLRWSPDGTRIAYVRAGAAAGDSIYVANADGSDERQVLPTRGGMHAHWIQWSHDGSAIYFSYSPSTANSEPTGIFSVPAAGGEVAPIVRTARRAAFPVALLDGNGLIYAANAETSELGLWWRSLDGALTRPLTVGLGEYAEPSVSRDGDRLVAASVEWDHSLVRLDAEGSAPPEALFEASGGDLDPTVSPDGSRVVFSSSRSGSRTLWNFTVADAKIRPLTSGNVFDERPSFSPDGARVAFVSDRGGQRGIWVMNADGGAPRHVTNADVLDMVSWSPDGRQLVFSAPAGTSPGLFVVDVAEGTTRQLQTPGPANSPAWCPKGDLIAYVEARAPAPDQPNSSRVAAITSEGAPLDFGFAMSPNVLNGYVSCSPDGGRILAFIDPGAAPSAIWMADVQHAHPFRRIYEAPPHVRFRGASWLPGGSAFVVGRSIRSADVVLFERVNKSGANVR